MRIGQAVLKLTAPRTPKGGVWTPAFLPGLALWFDADDAVTITLNGSNVSQWNDKSGNDRHATQATAANQPEYIASTAVLGGKPSVGATGTTGYGLVGMLTPSFAAREWLMVTAYLNGVTALFPGVYPTLLSGPMPNGFERAGMGVTATANWFPNSMWAAFPYRNGETTTSTTALPMPATLLRFEGPNTVTQTWGIGFNQVTTGRTWRGPIGEVIAVGETLSTADRQKAEGYLAWKWGLSYALPADHPYKWDTSLFGGTDLSGFDADAKTYITAVETADSQQLELGVRVAINDFVVGCKADGIWNAIKASCILAGARTLTGALVPLQGTAPTNFNFISGDYIRTTGLLGNSSTKYLDTNTNNNTTDLDNIHLAFFTTTATNGSMGVGSGATSGSTGIIGTSSRNRNSASSSVVQAANFLTGSSRQSSTGYTNIAGGVTTAVTAASQSLIDGDVYVFARNALPVAEQFSNARIAFYSFGDDLDLTLLNTRVITLIDAYAAAIS